MTTDTEVYDLVLTDLLNETLKRAFAKVEIITAKPKISGGRKMARLVKKARKEREQGRWIRIMKSM